VNLVIRFVVPISDDDGIAGADDEDMQLRGIIAAAKLELEKVVVAKYADITADFYLEDA